MIVVSNSSRVNSTSELPYTVMFNSVASEAITSGYTSGLDIMINERVRTGMVASEAINERTGMGPCY